MLSVLEAWASHGMHIVAGKVQGLCCKRMDPRARTGARSTLLGCDVAMKVLNEMYCLGAYVYSSIRPSGAAAEVLGSREHPCASDLTTCLKHNGRLEHASPAPTTFHLVCQEMDSGMALTRRKPMDLHLALVQHHLNYTLVLACGHIAA